MGLSFIDELLAETQLREQEQLLEMNKLMADKLLMAIRSLEGNIDEANQLADAEIVIIEEYRSKELARLNKQLNWLVFNLQNYMRSTGEKTLRLPHGILKIRKSKERAVVVDQDEFLKEAQKLGLLRTIPEEYAPDLQAIVSYIKRTGNLPDGIQFIPSEDKFSYLTTNGESENGEEQSTES